MWTEIERWTPSPFPAQKFHVPYFPSQILTVTRTSETRIKNRRNKNHRNKSGPLSRGKKMHGREEAERPPEPCFRPCVPPFEANCSWKFAGFGTNQAEITWRHGKLRGKSAATSNQVAMWTETGDEHLSHSPLKNPLCPISFLNPYGDQDITGSTTIGGMSIIETQVWTCCATNRMNSGGRGWGSPPPPPPRSEPCLRRAGTPIEATSRSKLFKFGNKSSRD